MKIKDLAISNYKKFCNLEGSDYIASEFAIETILNLISKFKINSILEIGLGIGSIADTVLKYAYLNDLNISYVGTEQNEFCLSALKENVEFYSKLIIHNDIDDIKENTFDLIIIDGYDLNLDKVLSKCKLNTLIYIEGARETQRLVIQKLFKDSLHVNIITLKKNPKYAHENRKTSQFIGGGQLIITNPTCLTRIFWLVEKIKTYLKRKIRIYLLNKNSLN